MGRGLLYSFYPGKSRFFNMAVTESDREPKVREKSLIFNDVAENELSMRSCKWNLIASTKPIFDLINMDNRGQVLDNTKEMSHVFYLA